MRTILALTAAVLSGGAATVAAASDGDAGIPEEAFLVPMDEIRVPIVDGGRADGTLRVKLVLQMADAASSEAASAELPRLRSDALLVAVEFGRLYASPMTPVDAERLARDMTGALRRADGGVARVLIVEVAANRA